MASKDSVIAPAYRLGSLSLTAGYPAFRTAWYFLDMDNESARAFCLSLPHATESVQWGDDLLFRVGNKIFAVIALNPSATLRVCFKTTPERFAELIENEDILPAPYMARNDWVALAHWDAVPAADLKRLLRGSYEMIKAKLPKKVQTGLGESAHSAPAERVRKL
jgi:predicted DNA-binding protein (MmcQ/YjbR family)